MKLCILREVLLSSQVVSPAERKRKRLELRIEDVELQLNEVISDFQMYKMSRAQGTLCAP